MKMISWETALKSNNQNVFVGEEERWWLVDGKNTTVPAYTVLNTQYGIQRSHSYNIS